MKTPVKELAQMVEQGSELFLANLSVDNVIFGYDEGELKVLLLEITDSNWMLPGGFILKDEDIDDATRRVLFERTGLEDFYLKQFYTFGKSRRSFSGEIKKLFLLNDLPWYDDLWINKRFVTTGYYALVHLPNTKPVAGIFARQIGWHPIKELPQLHLDHKEIIDKALAEFQKDLQVSPVAYHLLPKQFTMPELHRVYECVLQKKIDRSRFQKKMFEYDVFLRLDQKREGVPHRRPYLYHFKG